MEAFEKNGKRYTKKITGSIKKRSKTVYHSKGSVFIFHVKVK